MSASLQTPGVARPVPEAATVAVTVPKRSRWRRGIAQPKTLAGRIVLTVLLVGFALLFLYPFAWLLAASFKPRGEVFDNALIPKTFMPENYIEVWNQLPLLSWMWNSIAIATDSERELPSRRSRSHCSRPRRSRCRARSSRSASRTSSSRVAGCCSDSCSRR